jgi:D-glycero-alpha-D-manno-heptose-7-phosphate kinase
MIVTKTPLRISFFGGGSDIPQFYKEHGGICVSAAINSYIYIAAHKCVAPHLKVIYSQLELENDINQIKHDRVREVLKHYGQVTNMEIASFSNIPTKGTGLGSSSTFTVGLINAVANIVGIKPTHHQLAELASYIEIDKCGEPIGKQDQYAAAFGGLNIFEFNKDDTVNVHSLELETDYTQLQKNLLCFNTGIVRMASSVLTEQVEKLKTNVNVDNTKRIVDMAHKSVELLMNNNFDEFGILMNKSWQVKKQLSSNISNTLIDTMYDTAINAGALGGKILGAGGGGYLLVYVPENKHKSVLDAMTGYPKFNFEFDHEGSKVEMIA